MSTRVIALSAGCVATLLTFAVGAQEAVSGEAKSLSGMSVLGNNEAPKSLVIVPWKSSEIGDGIGIHNLLNGRAQPVDRDVFARELTYYELRSGSAGARSGSSGEAK